MHDGEGGWAGWWVSYLNHSNQSNPNACCEKLNMKMTFTLFTTTTPTVVFSVTIQVAETQHAVFLFLYFCILITCVCLFSRKGNTNGGGSAFGQFTGRWPIPHMLLSVRYYLCRERHAARKKLLRTAAL